MFREKLDSVAACEHCGIQGPTGYREAEKAGWRIVGEDCYCPQHTNSPLIGPEELKQFAQHLMQFIEVQERKTTPYL